MIVIELDSSTYMITFPKTIFLVFKIACLCMVIDGCHRRSLAKSSATSSEFCRKHWSSENIG